MTREEKWDALWRAACEVVAAYDYPAASEYRCDRVFEQCARLKRVVDEICPDEPESVPSPTQEHRQ